MNFAPWKNFQDLILILYIIYHPKKLKTLHLLILPTFEKDFRQDKLDRLIEIFWPIFIKFKFFDPYLTRALYAIEKPFHRFVGHPVIKSARERG